MLDKLGIPAAKSVSMGVPPKTQPFFGAQHDPKDSADLGHDLPDWAKKVKDPSITHAALLDELYKMSDHVDAAENKANRLKRGFASGGKMAMQARKLRKEKKKVSQQYLPEETKAQIKQYKRFQYWIDRITKPGHAKRMLVTLEGPVAIKAKQAEVEHDNANLKPMLEALVQKPTVITEAMAGKDSTISKLLNPVVKFVAKRKLKDIEAYQPLLNDVPRLPDELFKKSLDEVTEQFNRQHPDDPIQKVGKPIASGSVSQVYEAKTKSGQELVIKVRRPDLEAKNLAELRSYLYYLMLLIQGTQPEQKRIGAQETETHVDFLLREADLEREAQNLASRQQALENQGISSYQVAQALAATKTAMVLPKVGAQDLINLETHEQERIKQALAPDLMRETLLEDTKALDLHSGNFRTATAEDAHHHAIDAGRQIDLNSEQHAKLLKCLVLFNVKRKQHDTSHQYIIRDAAFMQALGDLLDVEHSQNHLARAVKKQQERIKAGEVVPSQEDELLLIDIVSNLFDQHGRSRGYDSDMHMHVSGAPGLLSTWSNYMLLCKTEKGLPKLSQEDISAEELENIRTKYTNFLAPGLMLGENQVSEAKKIVEDIQQKPESLTPVLEYYKHRYYQGHKEIRKLFDLSQSRGQEDKVRFKTQLDKILADEQASHELAGLVYQNQRLNELSKTLAEGLLQKTEALDLSEEDQKTLQGNVKQSLRDDFAAAFSKNKRL